MNDNLKILEQLLSTEVFSTLRVESFGKESIVSPFEKKDVFIIIEGSVKAVRYYEKREYLLPFRFSSGDIVGFFGNYVSKNLNWEFISSTNTKVLFIPEFLIQEKILQDFKLYKFFVEASEPLWSKITKTLYLQIHGNSKAAFAYLIVENSINNKTHFVKTENIYKAINISRTMLFKLEKKFTDKGLIKKIGKTYEILDREGLKSYYSEYLYLD